MEIYDLYHNLLSRYHLRDYLQAPQFLVLFAQPNLHIYQVAQVPDGIIYKERAGKFYGIQFIRFRAEEFIDNPDLVEVAKV